MPKKNNHIKSLPLSEVAYQKIKEIIVTLKLGPMDQVDEEWLAKKLSIGRTPIREALFRFIFLPWQFTTSIPTSGLYVLQQGTVVL